jgi:hypothetical protein
MDRISLVYFWTLTRLRTIANKLIRELQRKLSTHSLFETYQKDCWLICLGLLLVLLL